MPIHKNRFPTEQRLLNVLLFAFVLIHLPVRLCAQSPMVARHDSPSLSIDEIRKTLRANEDKLGIVKIVSTYRGWSVGPDGNLRLSQETPATTWIRSSRVTKIRADISKEKIRNGLDLKAKREFSTQDTSLSYDGRKGIYLIRNIYDDEGNAVSRNRAQVSSFPPIEMHSVFKASSWLCSAFGFGGMLKPTAPGGPAPDRLSEILATEGIEFRGVENGFAVVCRIVNRAGNQKSQLRLLLDPAHGYSPCLWQESNNGVKYVEMKVDGFLPIGNGLWFPKKATYTSWPAGKLEVRAVVVVHKAESVDASFDGWDVELPIGTRIEGTISRGFAVIGPNKTELDRIIDSQVLEAKKILEQFPLQVDGHQRSEAAKGDTNAPSSPWKYPLLVIGAFSISFSILLAIRNRKVSA